MTTPLDKTLKRELHINGRAFIVALSPDGVKLTLKGRRHGLQLRWTDLVNGEAALAVALNASVGKFAALPPTPTATATLTPPTPTSAAAPRAKRGTKHRHKVDRAAKSPRAPKRRRSRGRG
jgi:hypothetical protein